MVNPAQKIDGKAVHWHGCIFVQHLVQNTVENLHRGRIAGSGLFFVVAAGDGAGLAKISDRYRR